MVGLAGGYEVFGTPEQYELFVDKYLTGLKQESLCHEWDLIMLKLLLVREIKTKTNAW